MSLNYLLQSANRLKVDRDELIKSYGIQEQLLSNQNLFREILETVAAVCQCSRAYITLQGETELHFVSQRGKKLDAIPVEESLCQFTVESEDICIISDTSKIQNLSPLLEDCKFYAGYPLVNKDNIVVGCLCMTNEKELQLEEHQIKVLKTLSSHIMKTMDSQRGLIALIKKMNTNFKPSACSDLNCLQGELAHLQTEVVSQKDALTTTTEALKKSNERFERFAHVVAHDFKAPLRTIISFNQLVKNKLSQLDSVSENAGVSDYIEHIQTAGHHLNKLVNSVLDFSEVKTSEIALTPMSLHEILETVLLNLHAEIEGKQAIVDIPEYDIIVNGHKQQLVQLLQNLIENSLKYQADGNIPQININVTSNAQKHILQIQDNGIGMEKEHIATIFEPFKRLNSSSKYQGSGIGLATCHAILDNHDSAISVESQVGKGTKITFSLPKG